MPSSSFAIVVSSSYVAKRQTGSLRADPGSIFGENSSEVASTPIMTQEVGDLTLPRYSPKDVVVLLVEGETDDAVVAARALEGMGIVECGFVSTGEAALAWLEARPCDILLFEAELPRMSGLHLLQRAKAAAPALQAIAMSKRADARTAVSLIKHGACDFILKDDYFTSNLITSVQSTLRAKTAVEANHTLQVLQGAESKIEMANAEAMWLLKMFRGRYGYAIPAPAAREEEDQQWSEVVEAFREYLETTLRMFPDLVQRSEDALVRMIMERGLSPRDVVLLYQLSLLGLKERAPAENAGIRVHPGVLLSRVLVRLVEEYQRSISLAWDRSAA
jgi:CheY-like chemotaxis protein